MTYPDSGYMFSNSIWWLATGLPSPSNIRNLEEVVPQSMLPMNECDFFSASVSEIPRGRWRCDANVVVVEGGDGGGAFSKCADWISGDPTTGLRTSV